MPLKHTSITLFGRAVRLPIKRTRAGVSYFVYKTRRIYLDDLDSTYYAVLLQCGYRHYIATSAHTGFAIALRPGIVVLRNYRS